MVKLMILSSFFKFKNVFNQIPELLKKLPITLEVAVVSMLIAVLLGLILAIIKYKKVKVLSQLSSFYISVIRGTPLIVQLYIAYYGLPQIFKAIGISISGIPNITYAFVALGMYQSAYLADILRASLESVSQGEIEAASAMGMTFGQTLRRIIIPSALKNALPGLINSLIGLIKGTSLAFSVGVVEITAQAQIIAGRSYRYFEGYVALAIIYWVITLIIEQILRIVEKKITIPDQVQTYKKDNFVVALYKKIFKKNKLALADGVNEEIEAKSENSDKIEE